MKRSAIVFFTLVLLALFVLLSSCGKIYIISDSVTTNGNNSETPETHVTSSNTTSAIDPETSETPETTEYPENGERVYWTSGGKVWHYSSSCRSLNKSVSIITGSIGEAYASGMTRACKICDINSETTAPETTEKPEITTEPETAPMPSEDIIIVSYPKTAKRNEKVSLTIQALPNTKYHIVVNYKSGPSESKDLDEKISDSNGVVTWTWKVGARSAAGTFEIIVKDDKGRSVKVEWTIVVD